MFFYTPAQGYLFLLLGAHRRRQLQLCKIALDLQFMQSVQQSATEATSKSSVA